MDTFQAVSTLIFMLSIMISMLTAVYLRKKDDINLSQLRSGLSRRKFLLAWGAGGVAVLLVGHKIAYEQSEEKVVCNGWMLKRSELKPDACEPRIID